MPNMCDHYLELLEEGGDVRDRGLGETPEHRVCGLRWGTHVGFRRYLNPSKTVCIMFWVGAPFC